jgi:hypothetical protein
VSAVHRSVLSSRKPRSGCPGAIAVPAPWVPARARYASLAGMTGQLGYKFSYYFNDIKYIFQTVFPNQFLFLYWSNELWHADAPDLPRHCGGAFARAENAAGGRGSRKSEKSDEQFCCRSFGGAEPRQPHRRRCAARQQQCLASRHALCRTSLLSRPSRQSQIADPQFGRALRQGEGAAQSASGAAT